MLVADYFPVETMRRFHHFYADGLKIKCPTGSRIMSTLNEVADDVHHAGGKLDNPPLHLRAAKRSHIRY